jgi:fructuronate reductase
VPGDWSISGASLRSPNVRDALFPQDGLYSVSEDDGAGPASTVVACLHEVLFAPTVAEALLARIAAPATRIVSLTVTEKGYGHNPATGNLDRAQPDVAADLAGRMPPRSTLGWLVQGLARRRADGTGGLTVLCCDNMAENGRTLQTLTRAFARELDPGLASWIEDRVRFPSSMVDRIVPAATLDSLDEAASRLGLRDEAAVSCEAFLQWVIEDDFAAGRPAWEVAGAELVRDVRPYQTLKLQLLNGAHSAIAYAGALVGHPHVVDVMADPVLKRFVERLMLGEIAPLTSPPPGFDVGAYAQALLRRFANPSVRHRTLQIAMDASQKIPVRWLPILREARRRGQPTPHLVTALAAWMRFLVGRSETGEALPLHDPMADMLHRAADQSSPTGVVHAVLSIEPIFGDLGCDRALVDDLAAALERITDQGLRAHLSA